MIPILYNSNETQFTTEGICRLADCLRCNVIEERNGIYECEFEYPVTGRHYGDILEGRIIACTHDDTQTIQPFDIYKRTAPIDGVVTFYAHHISYRLGNVIIKPFSASTCVAAMSGMTANSINANPFIFWTDKQSSGSFAPKTPISVKEILGGIEGSVLDVFGGGDYEWDKFTVKLHANRGSDKGVEIRYGKNLADLTHERDISGSYNAVAPYWLGTTTNDQGATTEELVTLSEWIVMAEDADGEMVPVPMDLSSAFEKKPTEEQVRNKALGLMANNKPWEPNENVTVNFVALWQSPEYEAFSSLQRVSLCDTVGVIYTALGVNIKNKVIRTDYNVLMNRYDEIELGTVKTSFAEVIKAESEVDTSNLASKSFLSAAIAQATDLITGGTGGYVVIGKNANGQPNEILVMDTDNQKTAVKVLRINMNGIGFSSKGVGGPFASAWTLDGKFVADFIATGTLAAGLIKAGTIQDAKNTNSWNMETGEFKLASTATVGGKTVAAIASDAVNAQTQQSIFNKLTNGGQTQGIYLSNGILYINASYIATGILADAGNNTIFNLSTGELTMKKGSINIGNGAFAVSANGALAATKATLSGSIINVSGDYKTIINNGGIFTSHLDQNVSYIRAINWANTSTYGLCLTSSYGGKFIAFDDEPYSGATNSQVYFHLNFGLNNDGVTEPIVLGGDMRVRAGKKICFGNGYSQSADSYITGHYNTNNENIIKVISDRIILSSSSYYSTYADTVVSVRGGNLHVDGNIGCEGTKSRIVSTENYGKRALYCYETPSPHFGDIGEGVLDEEGICYVWLDDVLSEAIDGGCRYQVFLQKYGHGDVYVAERNAAYFVVRGDANLAFGWEVKAAQKGMTALRLDDVGITTADVAPGMMAETAQRCNDLLATLDEIDSVDWTDGDLLNEDSLYDLFNAA